MTTSTDGENKIPHDYGGKNIPSDGIVAEIQPLEVETRCQNCQDIDQPGHQDCKAGKSLKWRLKHDTVYRHKFIRTLCLSWSFIAFGWTMGQTGPSFLDLQLITGSTLEKASAFLTSGSVGYLSGSMISGFLHNKLHGDLLLFVCVFVNVVCNLIIPWCSIYEVMIFLMFLRHTFLGAWDTVGNAELIQIWGVDNMSYMQAIHFCFAFGGILSPLATAPFLYTGSPLDNNNTMVNISESTAISIYSDQYSVNTSTVGMVNNYVVPNGDRSPVESKLYLAYLTTSCLSATSAIWFLISYIVSMKRKKHTDSPDDLDNLNRRKISLISKVVIVINLMFIVGVYVATEETTMGFLTAFCVKQFNWTKANGSYATSAFWATFAFGRFLGIFIIRFFKPYKLIFTHILIIIFSFTGLLVTSLFGFSVGVWIFTPIAGFGMSVIFATIFTWTENELLPVTGKISSLFLIAASLGGMTNPLVIGTLMDTVTPMSFCYLLLGETILLFVLYISASLIAHRMNKIYGKLRKNIEISTENPDTNETFLKDLN